MSKEYNTSEEETDEERAAEVDVDTSHLDDVGDGCGCAEVWEHTSAQRG
jgi:hypothetical protein